MNGIINLSVELLEPHPNNPRKELGNLAELSQSIKENGIMQNLTVVPFESEAGTRYRVIIGHRRLAASKAAGLIEVPCAVVEMDEKTQLSTMLLENIQRSDLTAFEQAQGFQLMIDLGDTVSEVSKRTGFSESTIRKRLKLAELDQETLKSTWDRNITMDEYLKLSKIDDVKERNRLLKNIGTSNFNWDYEKVIKRQEVAKVLPQIKKDLRAMGANQIKGSQTYSGEYERYGNRISLLKWDQELLPKDSDKKKYYYELDTDYSCYVQFYIEAPKKKKTKRQAEEIAREKDIANRKDKLCELAKQAYEMRRRFVSELTLTSKNEKAIMRGALLAHIMQDRWYGAKDNTLVAEKSGDPNACDVWGEDRVEHFVKLSKDKNVLPALIYREMIDNQSRQCWEAYSYNPPKYKRNVCLELLYEWLSSLGYEASDEELALLNGTHELYEKEPKNE